MTVTIRYQNINIHTTTIRSSNICAKVFSDDLNLGGEIVELRTKVETSISIRSPLQSCQYDSKHGNLGVVRQFVSSLKVCRVKPGLLRITITPQKSLFPVGIPKTSRAQQGPNCCFLQIGGLQTVER
jgi:hypothetical protein